MKCSHIWHSHAIISSNEDIMFLSSAVDDEVKETKR